MQVVYVESAPLRHAHGIWLWPAKRAAARVLDKGSNEAILVTSR